MEPAKRQQPMHIFNAPQQTYTPAEIEELMPFYNNVALVLAAYQIVKGKVISLNEKDVVLDINGKGDASIPLNECKGIPDLKVGDHLEVYVVQQEDQKGDLVVSRKKAMLLKAWEKLTEAYTNKETLEGKVKRKIKGGLVLDILGIEVFLPGSLISTTQTTDFDEFLGHTLEVKVAKINKQKDNIVVSRKLIMEEAEEKQRKEILKNIERGQILSGTIKNITSFGVFVNLGGITGLLHNSCMAWHKRVDHLKDAVDEEGKPIFELNNPIEVAVKDFNLEKGYISLSTRLLAWAKLPEDIVEGSKIKGVVKEIFDSYSVIEIMKGVAGTLHIAEMSYSKRIRHPEDVIHIGQEIESVVSSIDRENQDLRLSLKALQQDPWESDEVKQYKVGERYKAKVCSIFKHGAYLELMPGVEGVLSHKHMSWVKKINNMYHVCRIGEEMEVMILDVDHEHRLFQLGRRELEENPWLSAFKKIFTIGSVHEGIILKLTPKETQEGQESAIGGAIIELPYSLQIFVPIKNLDAKKLKEGATGQFTVLKFFPDDQKLLLSQVKDTPEKKTTSNKSEPKSSRQRQYIASQSASTLGDIGVLKQLKEELAKKDAEDRKKKREKSIKK